MTEVVKQGEINCVEAQLKLWGWGRIMKEGIKRKKSRRAFGEYYTTARGNRQACREEDQQGDGQPSGGREGRGLRRGG